MIINAGTAGGFLAKGGRVGDVYVGTHLKHHDRRIPIPGAAHTLAPISRLTFGDTSAM